MERVIIIINRVEGKVSRRTQSGSAAGSASTRRTRRGVRAGAGGGCRLAWLVWLPGVLSRRRRRGASLLAAFGPSSSSEQAGCGGPASTRDWNAGRPRKREMRAPAADLALLGFSARAYGPKTRASLHPAPFSGAPGLTRAWRPREGRDRRSQTPVAAPKKTKRGGEATKPKGRASATFGGKGPGVDGHRAAPRGCGS